MNLKIQILTLLFSFLFGTFFYFGLEIHQKILQRGNRYLCFFGNFLYVLINTFLYFLLMRKINNAIFHPYEIGMIIIGYLLGYFLYYYIEKKYQ